ncbi:bifunctional helix-turn-helix transcriptional regulator/GNAT family N-acetyltransferase [Fulvivirga sedimenti]|uniref:Bifunctional helix-turn-helix transcriptional regulator/GNAT family N-acetyltransferase n=1 Tax=Fulvivirga sedimenti TaxID=2879465 RepID=A0A9X1HKH8_9BACT|nr:bifunctional helix-turn-helix transcriptional regulator/GNAT family N-acetyltransferase [Fulvivirga sedimenti]MCA6073521.1 bifunctional helix-turn-helix transcriptional regulator/GNAT family N-acetyltransferase [Fulvivirga sedimenti]
MLYKKAGFLTLGSRLKRLGDRALTEVRTVYSQSEVVFETSWFPVFYVLQQKPKCSILELSRELEVSHSAISQLIAQLERKGLIDIRISNEDQRRKEIVLTPEGNLLMEKVLPMWRAFEMSFREHLDPSLLQTLDDLEAALDSGQIASTALDILHRNEEVALHSTTTLNQEMSIFLESNDVSMDQGNRFITVRQGELLVGIMCFTPHPNEILMSDIYVLPGFRKRGLAGKMFAQLFSEFGSKPVRMHKTSPELLHLLHKTGYSFTVDTVTN